MSNYIRNNLTGGLAPVNKELEKIEQVLREKLDRLPEQGQANQLTSDLDVNNQRILNVPAPSNPTDLIRLKDLDGFTNGNGKLPPQDGQAGEWLRTDGTAAYWDALPDFDKGGISPEDFGAVGDGVTDDTAALQAAINAAKGEGSLGLPVSYVRLENKTYTHTGIVIDRAVAIVGVDRNSTRLKCLSTSAPAIQVSLAHDGNNYQVGGRPGPTVLIKDVIVESDKTFASSNHGIEFVNASSNAIRGWVYLDGADIHSMGGSALSASTWEGAVKANNCKFLNNGGKQLNATSCADWQFVGCEFGVTPDDNILLSGCAAFTFTTCNIYSSTGDLVTLFTDAAATAPVNHHFVSCSFDRSSEGHGVVYNVRNSGNVTFTNCYWTYNGQGAPETYSDIWIDSSVRRGPSIVGGWFQSAADSDSLYNIFFNGALSSCYTTGVQFEAGNARSANVTNAIAQLKFEGAENFATFTDLEACTWVESGDKAACIERANAEYVAKAGSAIAGDGTAANGRVWELQLNGSAYAEWFPSLQDAVTRMKALGGGDVYAFGYYTITAPLVLDGGGVTVHGAPPERVFDNIVSVNKSGVIYGDFTTGPMVLISDSGSHIQNITIKGGATRRAASITTGAQNTNAGLLIEGPDNSSDILQSVSVRNVKIASQPADGLLIEGDATNADIDNVYTVDCGRHGKAISSGDIGGRTNKKQPGIIRISGGKSFDCGGHGLCVGHPSSSQFPYRITVDNHEGYRLALDAAKRYVTSANFFVAQNSELRNCAFEGTTTGNVADHEGIEVGGRDIKLVSNRYINCSGNYAVVRQQSGFSTLNIEFDGGTGITSGSVTDFATIAAGADGVTIQRINHDCTNPITDISVASTNSDVVLHDAVENLTVSYNHRRIGDKAQGVELTIASGVVSIEKEGYYRIDTESNAASDNLDTINNGVTGDVIVLKQENSGRTVSLTHGVGNIRLKGATTFTFTSSNQFIQLMYDGTNWRQIAEAINNA